VALAMPGLGRTGAPQARRQLLLRRYVLFGAFLRGSPPALAATLPQRPACGGRCGSLRQHLSKMRQHYGKPT